jgi:putative MATE family efflux protein
MLLKTKLRTILNFFSDREYYRLLVKFALPIALQNLIMSSLNMAAVMMIGQLGEVSVASVGLANQIFFLLNLMVFGIVSGAAMFVAQFWGKQDVHNISRVVGLTLKLALIAAFFFWFVSQFFANFVLKLYTSDPQVITQGAQYLRILSWSFGFFAVSAVFSVASRSTGNVRLPLFVSTTALGLNILLAFPLIFGIKALGIPALGTSGAAIAGVIARSLECLAIVWFTYRDKGNPAAASLKDIISFDQKFFRSVMKPILPVIANETLWSLGITTYNSIYGHVGTDAVAAMNMVSTIDQIAFVIFLGLGTATAIMVGNLIGQDKRDQAFIYGGRSLLFQALGAMVMGLLVYLFAGQIFQFYKVSPNVIADAKAILTVMSIGMFVRASNHAIIIGILRSGGDTKFSLILDGLVIWIVGVPATAAGAFLFHLPIYFVYALTLTEETAKVIIGLWRYFSRRWIHDLTEKIKDISSLQAG